MDGNFEPVRWNERRGGRGRGQGRGVGVHVGGEKGGGCGEWSMISCQQDAGVSIRAQAQ